MNWDGQAYDQRFTDLAAAGEDVHGEATLVASLVAAGGAVLDAGCGTGRVGIELARRGFAVVGVDIDASMLAAARAKAPSLRWIDGDLATMALDAVFDAAVLAGNVMIFVSPGTAGAVVANVARHVRPGGLVIAGFTLRLGLEAYDTLCAAAGLVLDHRWATWDRAPYTGGDYAISVHHVA